MSRKECGTKQTADDDDGAGEGGMGEEDGEMAMGKSARCIHSSW